MYVSVIVSVSSFVAMMACSITDILGMFVYVGNIWIVSVITSFFVFFLIAL